MSVISVEFQYDFADYLKIHRLMARKRRFLIRMVLSIAAAIFFYRALAPFGAFSWMVLQDFRFQIGLASALYAFVLSPMQFYWRVRYRWRRYPAVRDSQKFQFDEHGVYAFDDAGQKSRNAWDKFYEWKESRDYLVMRFAPTLFLAIPKRALTGEGLALIKAWLSAAHGK